MWFHDNSVACSERLKVVGIGYPDNMRPCMVDRPYGTDDYLFMYFPTPVQVWVNGSLRDFPADTFFLWPPGNRHTFGNPHHRWCHCWMHCSGEAVRKLVDSSGIPLNQPLQFENSYLPECYLKPIHEELKRRTTSDIMILEAYLTLFVRMIAREITPQPAEKSSSERIRVATRYLSMHLAQPVCLTSLAKLVNLSVSRFCFEFKTVTGTSPIRFQLDQRLCLASHLLRDRNLNVAEVAQRTGFNDQFYFSRQFRRKFGSSPLQYRKKII